MKSLLHILLILVAATTQIFAQCNCNAPVTSFPVTTNGITVNVANSGNVQSFPTLHTNCSITASGNWVGQATAFSQTFSFSSPVNNVRVLITAADTTENFSFSANAGILTTSLCSDGCPNFRQTGNTFFCNNYSQFTPASLLNFISAGPGPCNPPGSGVPFNPSYAGVLVQNSYYSAAASCIILLTSTVPFTAFTMSGTGGQCPYLATTNGSIAGLCVESICIPPTINLSSVTNPVICSGGSSVITPGGATTYTLNPGNLTGTSFTVSPLATTTYTIIGQTGSCVNTTAGSALATITVNPKPTVTINAASSTICTGQTTTLTASGATSYTWTGGPVSATNVVSPLVSTTYTVSGTNAFGCTNSTAPTTQLVTVKTTPTISVVGIGNPIICAGSSATITAAGSSSYTLTTGTTTLTTNPFVLNPLATAAYTLTGSDATGCPANKVYNTITVNPTPSVTVNSTAVGNMICSGQTATLTATGAATYTLNPGNQTGSSFTVSPLANTTYTIMGQTGAGCLSSTAGSALVTLTVNPNPTVLVNASPNTICSGQTTTLTASGATSYTWTGGPVSATNMVSPAVSTTYTVIGTNAFGCTNGAAPTTQLVTVQTTPTISIASVSNPTLCVGASATITASGSTNYTLTAGTITLTTNPFVVSPLANTVYTLTGSGANGCISNPIYNPITVNPTPTVMINSTAVGNAICSGQTATLSATGATTYTWSGGITGSSTAVSPLATTVYTVMGSSAFGCNGSATSATVMVNPVATLSAIPQQSVACFGETTTVTALASGGTGSYTYHWEANSSVTQTAIYTSGVYTVNVSDINQCRSNTQTVTITGPAAALSIAEVTVVPTCFGQNTGAVTIAVTGGTPTYTVVWSNMANGVSVINTGVGDLSAIATDMNGCKAYYTTNIVSTHCVDVFIPQFFSPNNDSKNDVFAIQGIEEYPNNKLLVYNRWGSLVYAKNDYQNNWDGRSNVSDAVGSDVLPSGTYFLVFDFGDNKTKAYHGYIELKR